jgi:hypothetical protein
VRAILVDDPGSPLAVAEGDKVFAEETDAPRPAVHLELEGAGSAA